MNVIHLDTAHEDDRGRITDILQHVSVEHVTIIATNAGARRGDHYHKETTQYLYVLSGTLRAFSRRDGHGLEVTTLIPGDLWISEPLERHAIEALTSATFLVLTRGPRGGNDYESDTFREAV